MVGRSKFRQKMVRRQKEAVETRKAFFDRTVRRAFMLSKFL